MYSAGGTFTGVVDDLTAAHRTGDSTDAKYRTADRIAEFVPPTVMHLLRAVSTSSRNESRAQAVAQPHTLP